ncbi:MAG: putative Fe-S cluster assembly protein SufT [Deltaproteobacteria bacterium]|nr:putative Fe-S cluster assembly protein SufT [Deltaproteobacteria bacterium]
MSHEDVELQRDCEAIRIPQGIAVLLPKGTHARIAQALGGTYTLQLTSSGGLVRLADKDADAIGKTPSSPAPVPSTAGGPVTEELVWDQLRQVFDPEIPINVVDLGLIYDLQLEPLPQGQTSVLVQMTLTAQGCGMGPTIARDAQRRIQSLTGVTRAEVRVVWDPPWHPEMMSAEGKKRLGVD